MINDPVDIDQVDNSNVLKFDVNGATFTGTFSTTGNSNDIDFNCDSTGNNSSCATDPNFNSMGR